MILMTLDINGGIDTKARAFMPALTSSIKKAIRGWHQSVLPGHFRLGAARKYGYQTRDTKYQNYKRRVKRGAPALVYSGRSKRILSLPMRTVGTKGHVRGKFASNSAMRYFWMTPTGRPDKPAELKAMIGKEKAAMNKGIKKMTAGEINQIKTARRVK